MGISTDQWLTTVTYYDQKYQTIQAISDLYPSGTEITSNTHDFLGNVTQTKVKQSVGGSTYEYNKWFNYDNFGRLLSIQQQITGDASNGKVTLASYTYDNLGNVASKSIHNGAETETYTYDLNGRVIASTSPSFSYTLDYEQSDLPGATPRLDGQITALRWGAGQTPNRAYAYTYDPVGQLSAAAYKTATNGTWSASNAYAEKNLTYDRHGNIKTLQRTDANGSVLHELSDMTYTGNKLQSLKLNGGSPVNYAYDQNGNITSDGRRGVTINYNILNFPEQIVAGNQQISYIYSTSGEKLATNANGSLTYYRSVMVYGNDNKLLYMLTPEGTATRTEGSAGTNYTYNYFKTDHLGSTRVLLSAVNGTLQASQTTDFYPFGLAFEYNNLNKNKYLFSGKELQDGALGNEILGWYDFGARFYDPILGRWFNVDPAAQMANPYLFCGNAPMMYVDPDGNFFGLFSAAIGAIAGALIGGTINVLSHLNEIHNFWGALGYFGVGAVMGVISSYTGFWAADATKALGFIPGMLAGGLMGSTTGLANSFLLTGMNNLISGNSFMDNMGKNVTSGLLNGLITGALSGGIKGFQTAKEKDANPVTGYKVDETSIIDYGRTDLESKGYVPPQQDNSKLCYASALEYADKGHGDRPASFFAQIAENAPGDDPALVANEVKDITPTASYPSQMSITEWKQLGESLNRNVEFIGTYGATSTSHAVNIIGLRLGKVYRIFGGGVGRKLKPLRSIIWNPIGGKIQTVKPNFNKIIRIKY